MLYKIFWGIRALLYKPFFKRMGYLSYLGKPIFLHGTKKTTIGNKVRIYPHSRIETHGDTGHITIEDNCSIGQNFHIISSGGITIEKNTLISFDVMITDTDHDYHEINIPVPEQNLIIKKTHIGSNCFIGSSAKIQAGTILGKQCVVGANAVVRGTFPDYSVIVGIPAKIVKRYNESSGKWEKTNAKGEFTNEI